MVFGFLSAGVFSGNTFGSLNWRPYFSVESNRVDFACFGNIFLFLGFMV